MFNKLVRVMVKFWRAKGIRCMMFFDDGSAGAASLKEAKEVVSAVEVSLGKAGWKINREKSCLTSTQGPKILGFVLDLVHGKKIVRERRVKVLKEQLALLLDESRPNAKECARLTGILISMHVALGPVARLRTRGLYSLILNRKTWYHRVEWPAEAKGEVEFWWRYFHEFHGKFFVPDPKITAVVPTWSDASDMG